MEDMKVTTTAYDFRPARAAMQRYVDGNLVSGFSSAVPSVESWQMMMRFGQSAASVEAINPD